MALETTEQKAQQQSYSDAGAGSPLNYSGRYYGYYSAPQPEDKPLREYIAVVYQHKLIIILCTVVGLLFGWWAVRNAPKVYQASALVNVGIYVPAVDGPMAEVLRSESGNMNYVSSQFHLLDSFTIANYVMTHYPEVLSYFDPKGEVAAALRKQAVSSDRIVAEEPDEFAELSILRPKNHTELNEAIPVGLLDAYLKMLTFHHVENTSLVRIVAMTGDPQFAAKVVNAHAEAFIELVRQRRLISATVNLDFLRNRVSETKAIYEEHEQKLLAFVKEHGANIGAGDATAGLAGEKFKSLVNGLSQSSTERAALEGQLRQLRSSNSIRDFPSGDKRQELLVKLTQLDSDYNLLKRSSGQAHPVVRKIKREMTQIQDALRVSARHEIKEYEIRYRAAAEKERFLRSEFDILKKSEAAQSSKKLEYGIMKAETDAAKIRYEDSRKRLEDTAVNARNDQQNVTIVDRGVPPTGPMDIGARSRFLTGLFTGFLVGVLLAFVIDFFSNSVSTVSELKYLTKAPVLGMLPSIRGGRTHRSSRVREDSPIDLIDMDTASGGDWKANSASLEGQRQSLDEMTGRAESGLIVVSSPLSKESEAFRNIRTTLRYSGSKPTGSRKILVTSAQKGDGKTTVAANLAASIAFTSAKSILVDADLRLPTVHNYFHLARETAGLADYLLGTGSVDPLIIQSEVPNLDLLLAGTSTSGPAELLESKRMEELLEYLGSRYDLVMIDSPPVAHVTDALLLAGKVDGVVFVARSGHTSKPVIEYAANRLRQVKANVLGAVLNDVKRKHAYREAEYYYIKNQYQYYAK